MSKRTDALPVRTWIVCRSMSHTVTRSGGYASGGVRA